MRIYFKGISWLKFAKFQEYFKYRPEAKSLKKYNFCDEKLSKQYNYMFLPKQYKIPSFQGGGDRGVNLPSPYFLSQFLPPP